MVGDKIMIIANYTNFSIPDKRRLKETAPAEPPIKNLKKTSLELPNYTYNQLQVKRSNLSFGRDIEALKLFEKRINFRLQDLKEREILLFGDSIEKARAHLTNITDTLINRVFFIQEESIDGVLAAVKNPYGDISITNLAKSPVSVDGQTAKRFAVFNIESSGTNSAGATIQAPKYNVVIGNTKLVIDLNTPIPSSLDIISGIQEFPLGKKSSDEIKIAISHLNAMRIRTGLPVDKAESGTVTFADIGGLSEAKKELKRSIIFPVQHLAFYKRNGKPTSGGVLLVGPPGTGKTILGQALAGEAGAHYIEIKGPELENMFVGNTEKNWRNKFEEARNKKPCIIFIDEGDAQARERKGSEVSRHDDKTTNQLLTLLSDVEKNKNGEYDGVFVVMATNHKEIIDSAMLRSGRLTKHIKVDIPNEQDCLEILKIYTKDRIIAEDFKPEEFAKELHKQGCTGADIAQITISADQNAMGRSNVYEQMEQGTFDDSANLAIEINAEDFQTALADFAKQKEAPAEKEIGFKPSKKI